MIKAEVVFDGDDMYCNNKKIDMQAGDGGSIYVFVGIKEFDTLEQAIAYCMEHNNAN